jgi:RNA-directed DNA polymerase
VRGNKGARTAGVDGRTACSIQDGQGVGDFLDGLRTSLRDRSFQPLPVRERMIPKAGGKLRRLGIAMPNGRTRPSGLGMSTRLDGAGRYLPCWRSRASPSSSR